MKYKEGIGFTGDREVRSFTAIIHRKAVKSSVKSSGKTSGKILAALQQDGNFTIPELASLIREPDYPSLVKVVRRQLALSQEGLARAQFDSFCEKM